MQEHIGSFAILVEPDGSHPIPDALFIVFAVTNILGDKIRFLSGAGLLFPCFRLRGLCLL